MRELWPIFADFLLLLLLFCFSIFSEPRKLNAIILASCILREDKTVYFEEHYKTTWSTHHLGHYG